MGQQAVEGHETENSEAERNKFAIYSQNIKTT